MTPEREQTPFAPEAVRVLSVLPETDTDEAYCVRHDRQMRAINSFVHTEGALYTTAPEFTAYTCPECLVEIGDRTGTEPVQVYREHLAQAFGAWDQGETPRDWFEYVGEVDEIDLSELKQKVINYE